MSTSESIANNRVLPTRAALPTFEIESPMLDNIENQSPTKKAVNYMANKWDYFDKSITLSRRFIGVILTLGRQISKISHSLNEAIKENFPKIDAHFKLLSLINIPFELISLPSKINNLWKSVKWKDGEGTVHSTVILSLSLASLFDNTITSLSGILYIHSKPAIEWVAAVGAPLGVAVYSVVALTKCSHLYQLSKFNRELDRKIQAIQSGNGSDHDMRILLTPFLRKHLGVGPHRPKAQAALKRHTSPETLAKLLVIEKLLEDADYHTNKINFLLKSVQEDLKDQKKLQGGLLVATIISVLAWSLFLTPAAPAAPFVLLAVSLALQIGLKVQHSLKNKRKAAGLWEEHKDYYCRSTQAEKLQISA